MSEKNLTDIAENARFVVNGYAFSEEENGFVSIVNLLHPECAMVINREGELIETNMDPIEQKIVLEISRRNLQFMEDEHA